MMRNYHAIQVFNTYAFPPAVGNRQWAGTFTTFVDYNSRVWNGLFGITLQTEAFVIQVSGYYYATSTGTYTFSMGADDASYFWIGSAALTPWTTNTMDNQNMVIVGNTKTVTVYLSAGVYYSVMLMYGQNVAGFYFVFGVTPPGGTLTSDLSVNFFSNTGSSFAYCPTTQVSLGSSTSQCCDINRSGGIVSGCCNASSTPTFNGGVVGVCCPSGTASTPFSLVNTVAFPKLSCCLWGHYFWSGVCCPPARQNPFYVTCCPSGSYYTSNGVCCANGLVNIGDICCSSGQINVNMQCAEKTLIPNKGLFYQVLFSSWVLECSGHLLAILANPLRNTSQSGL